MAQSIDTAPQRFPQAPSQEVWDRLSEAERRAVVNSLPNEVTDAEMSPPEGDAHFLAKVRAFDALDGFFRRKGRNVYLACELPIYYPDAPRFAPDLLAVLDVDPHERMKWLVTAEGKGLDFVLEVHVGGDRRKDTETNVARYASLGIPEYFIYDRAKQALHGYSLIAPGARRYTRIVPQGGVLSSRILGLELGIESDRLRFYTAMAPLPESPELVSRLQQMMLQVESRADDEARLRQEAEERAAKAEERAARAADEVATTKNEADRQVAELRAELDRLRGKPH